MKNKNILTLVVASALFSWASAPAANIPTTSPSPAATTEAATPPITLAVLPFESTDTQLKGQGADLAALLSAQLSTKQNVWLVERTEIDKVLGEQGIALSGLTDPSTQVKVGSLLGAKALVTGRLIKTGDTYVMVAKIISTETSRVFGETASAASAEAWNAATADLADKISADLDKQAAAFNPPVQSLDDLMAHLRTQVSGKKLPSIQISLAEQDATKHAIIDPAAQTEFKKMFSDLGFQIIDAPKPGQTADILITGSGLSQQGAHHGELMSARGRVEIQAVRQSDGKVLVVDRETSVAVDTAEAVAGKTALQNASEALVARIIPKLIQP